MTRSNVEMPNEVQAWVSEGRYKEGFFTQLATDELAMGINEDVVRAISAKRNEPEWMLEFRLEAYRAWLQMEEPHWLKANYERLNYQDYSYYSAPSCGSCDDACGSQPGAEQQPGAPTDNNYLTSEVELAFNQLGVPVREGSEVAVDAIFDSVSVSTTYREKLAESGVIFCSFGDQRIKRTESFIHQKNVRIIRQCAGKSDTLLHSSAELIWELVFKAFKTDKFKRIKRFLLTLFFVDAL